jgi:hypothetical protein
MINEYLKQVPDQVLEGSIAVKADFTKYLKDYFETETELSLDDKIQLLKSFNKVVEDRKSQKTQSEKLKGIPKAIKNDMGDIRLLDNGLAEWMDGKDRVTGSMAQYVELKEKRDVTPKTPEPRSGFYFFFEMQY